MFSTRYIRKAVIDVRGCPDAYPYNLPVVRENHEIAFANDVTFLIGENGSGKSTLVEALAVAYGFNAEGGTKHYAFSTSASHSDLHQHIRLVKGTRLPREGFFYRAESFYNAKTYLDEIDLSYGGRSMHAYSHGESLLVFLAQKCTGDGLYIFDEPEAALSPQSQMRLLARISRLLETNAQFIIATHSPLLLAYPGATIFQIGEDGALNEVAYEATDYYAIYKYFLNNYQRVLDDLTT